jgi:hypothetical protein
MYASPFGRVVSIAGVLVLSACASQPSGINDICAVFEQRDGWLDNWRSAAYGTEQKYGIPVHVLMATVRKESGFKGNARPPRKKLLGVIPWSRKSSAYGYSQALNGTWSQYQLETGNFTARRTNFADAVDFIGWYHVKTAEKYGVAPTDAYRLYLAYYMGWTGYQRGDWQNNANLKRFARETEEMAGRYASQLQSCAP